MFFVSSPFLVKYLVKNLITSTIVVYCVTPRDETFFLPSAAFFSVLFMYEIFRILLFLFFHRTGNVLHGVSVVPAQEKADL